MRYTYKINEAEEIKRLQALLSYSILDTPPQEEFDNLVKLISIICDAPIAIISMIDNKRQWYKAKTGISQSEVRRDETFCQYTLEQEGVLEIPDAREDNRVRELPLSKAKEGIRFYAGVNLKSSDGYKIGTVCVVDSKPKQLNQEQKLALKLIADQTMVLLEARKKNDELRKELEEIVSNKVKETQRQLLKKQTEYNELLLAIKKANAVVEFSPAGSIISVNDNYLEMVGYSRKELVGKNREILIDEDQRAKNEEFWAAIKNGHFQSGRVKRRHKNGSAVWIQASYNPISDEQNNIVKVVKIGQDITKETELEKSLFRSKELAERLNIQKDHFIANMSHEIRTPIHAILGFTDLLLEQEQDPSKKIYLDSVKTAGDNLLYIINDILDLSKIEAGIIQLDMEPFDLLLTIEKVFSILHLKAHQKKLSFQYHIHPKVTSNLIGDKNRLTQILINLLGNAIKFTSSGSVDLFIEPLSRAKETTILEFRIVDTGIGIPREKQESIFDRFSQADEKTSRNYGGTGLGLNISQQLVKRQGGSIRVESEVGKGSVFVLELTFKTGRKVISPTFKEVPKVSTGKKKGDILLCEDNELNQRLIKAILSEQGYNVVLAENGKKGVEFLKKSTYDLVLMDIQMPLMDGYEATREIRQEIGSSVPIVALTANFLLSEKAKCLQTGMNDYLPKPFTKGDILSKVNQWIEGSEEKLKELSHSASPEEAFSLSILEELSGGDKEFEKDMMILFLQQGKRMLEELKIYSETKELEGIRSTAHKFKSSFGIIGANSIILTRLENITESGLISPGIKDELSLLEEQLNEIFHRINELINPPQT